MRLETWNMRQGWFVLVVIAVLGTGCAGSAEQAAFDLYERDAGRVSRIETAPADTAVLGKDPTLDRYLELGIERNPSIRAARRTWKAFLERAPQAGSLPDPMLSYGVFLQEVETRVGPQKQRVGISQSFPWFGILGLKKDAALAAAEAARQTYRGALDRITRDITAAYAEYYYLASALRITRDNLDLLRGWEGILRARYTAGSAGYSDLVKVQVELGKLGDRLRTLEQRRAPVMAGLLALLDLPSDTVLPLPETVPEPPPPPTRDRLLETIRDRNPELLALAAQVKREDFGVKLADKAKYPDFSLGVDWIQTGDRPVDGLLDNGKDPILARVAVRLPIWRKAYAAGSREARARRESAEARRRDRRNALEHDLESRLFRYQDARRRVDLYRDSMIPKGNQSLNAAFAAFEAGDGDFLSVLDAERLLLEFHLVLERARADALTAAAAIRALEGRAASPDDDTDRSRD